MAFSGSEKDGLVIIITIFLYMKVLWSGMYNIQIVWKLSTCETKEIIAKDAINSRIS